MLVQPRERHELCCDKTYCEQTEADGAYELAGGDYGGHAEWRVMLEWRRIANA